MTPASFFRIIGLAGHDSGLVGGDVFDNTVLGAQGHVTNGSD